MSDTKHLLKVFLCYAHIDKEVVRNLHARIRENGIHAWFDAEDLQPGQNWQHEIRKAILKSDVVIVCLSREFNKQHGYRHQELRIALEKANVLDEDEVFIIPVRLEKCDMPESLRHLQRVDVFKPGGFKKLIDALQMKIHNRRGGSRSAPTKSKNH